LQLAATAENFTKSHTPPPVEVALPVDDPILYKVAVLPDNPRTNKSSVVAEMGDRLATIDMDGKSGSAVPPFWGVWGGTWVPT